MTAQRQGWDPEFGQLRSLVAAANTQPAAAHYLRRPGENEYRPLALDVLRLEGGRVAEITTSLRSYFRRSAFPLRSDHQFFADPRSKCERTNEGRSQMRILAVNSFISLDGVMQAPGGPDEDPTGGLSSAAGASTTWTTR